jgi:hypothetical protein
MRLLAFVTAALVPTSLCAFAMLGGCADPAAPLPEGGWSLTFAHGTSPTCDISTHNGAVGTVIASGTTKLVTDGVDGASVQCSVTAASGGFKVANAYVYSKGSSVRITIDNITKDATQDAPATGSVAYVSSQTQNIFQSTAAKPCNFYFLDPAEGVSAGNLWVAFSCEDVAYETQDCAINSGYIKVINCDGAVIE